MARHSEESKILNRVYNQMRKRGLPHEGIIGVLQKRFGYQLTSDTPHLERRWGNWPMNEYACRLMLKRKRRQRRQSWNPDMIAEWVEGLKGIEDPSEQMDYLYRQAWPDPKGEPIHEHLAMWDACRILKDYEIQILINGGSEMGASAYRKIWRYRMGRLDRIKNHEHRKTLDAWDVAIGPWMILEKKISITEPIVFEYRDAES